MKSILLAFFGISILTIFTSCGGNDTPPIVTIVSPQTDTTFNAAEVIEIEFYVTSESNITEATINSSLPGDASISVPRETPTVGQVEYTISDTAPVGTYDIEVIITDSDDNVGSDVLTVLIL